MWLIALCVGLQAGCGRTDTTPTRPDAARTSPSGADTPSAAETSHAELARAIEREAAVDVEAVDEEIARIRDGLLVDRFLEDVYTDAVDESAIEARYRANEEEFVSRRIELAHVLVRVPANASAEERAAALTRAREIEALVHAGTDFAEVAAEHSDDEASADRGGALGRVTEGEIDAGVMETALAMAPGEVSAPVVTDYGVHVLHKLAATETAPRPLAEVRARIVRDLRAEARAEAISQLALSD